MAISNHGMSSLAISYRNFPFRKMLSLTGQLLRCYVLAGEGTDKLTHTHGLEL
jgi:hypothetical protein